MRPHGKFAAVDASSPKAFAQCDRCGFWYNRDQLTEQIEWGGMNLYSTQALVCTTGNNCYDKPNPQLRTIILPPDPVAVQNARPPNFEYEEAGPIQTTLSEDVAQGAVLLPVESVTGFEVSMLVWVQLNNADFAKCQVTGVDADANVLSILSPLPFSAPNTGQITAVLGDTYSE